MIPSLNTTAHSHLLDSLFLLFGHVLQLLRLLVLLITLQVGGCAGAAKKHSRLQRHDAVLCHGAHV